MGFLDTLQDAIDKLTGKRRQEQQEAARDTTAQAGRRETAKEQQPDGLKLVTDSHLKAQLTPDLVTRILGREPVQPEPRPEPEKVATKMSLTPGLQAGPSPGGSSIPYRNPLVRQVQAALQVVEAETPAVQPTPIPESFVDRVMRQGAERQAAEAERIEQLTPEQRQAEAILKQLEQGKVGQIERQMHRRGLEVGD